MYPFTSLSRIPRHVPCTSLSRNPRHLPSAKKLLLLYRNSRETERYSAPLSQVFPRLLIDPKVITVTFWELSQRLRETCSGARKAIVQRGKAGRQRKRPEKVYIPIMGNKLRRKDQRKLKDATVRGCHECEIMKEGQGVAESEFLWKTCEKNPKHEKFIPFHNDLNTHTALLPHRIHRKGHRHIKAAGDLVVRLRVQWTSPDRPDDDDLSSYRGTGRLRLGSGFIQSEDIESESSAPCPCGKCDGASASRSWIFSVWTACHVVYNTEEAKRVKVDLFYDDENSELEGRMKSLWPVSVKFSNPNLDICEMACVTHDEKLAERIISIERNMDREIFSHLDLRPLLKNDLVPQLISEPSHGGQKLAVCISHPHGQPKMLTIGKVISCEKGGILKYDTPTCPGSSGGPVFVVDETYSILWLAHAHTGVHRDKPRKLEGHINYCNMLGYRM